MAYDADSYLTELMILVVRQGLRRGDDNALSGVNAQRVKVLHVADRNTIVIAVPYYLVLYFLPSLEALLDEDLRGEGEGLATELI